MRSTRCAPAVRPAHRRRAIELTAGQPWLVNALAREVVEEIGVPLPEPITIDHVEQAKERLILARATHLDSLALTDGVEAVVFADPRSFVLPDGRFDVPKMVDEFAEFWMKNGEILAAGRRYPEAAPQLVLMGFLQRVVNGGGYVEREYGIGRGRIDLLIRWPYTTPDGKRHWQREALELKVRREGEPDPVRRPSRRPAAPPSLSAGRPPCSTGTPPP